MVPLNLTCHEAPGETWGLQRLVINVRPQNGFSPPKTEKVTDNSQYNTRKGDKMSIGTGIFLMALGAILSFAVAPTLGAGVIDLVLVGYILIGAGAVVTIIGLALLMKKRKTSTTIVEGRDPASNQHVTQQETATNL
jgi:hypothetical protein